MIVCPTCGKENEDFFRFCLGCGTDLEEVAGAGEAEEERAPEPAPEAEGPPTVQDRPAVPGASPPGAESAPPAPAEAQPPVAAESTEQLSLSDMGTLDTAEDAGLAALEARRPQTDRGAGREPRTGACPVCGAPDQEAYAYCSNCGAPLQEVSAERAPVPEPAEPRSGVERGRIVLIREDGTDGPAFALDESGTVVGREGGHVNFEDDDFLADRHAELVWRDDRLEVHPLESTNGVFMRLFDETELETGDSFRVGQQLLRFDRAEDLVGAGTRDVDEEGTLRLASPLPRDVWGRLSQQIGPTSPGNAWLCFGDDVRIGRERGHITFPADGYVSGSHAAIVRQGERVLLKDLGSSNGTYLRMRRDTALRRGDFLLVGQQLFRVEPG
ncbi:MAG: FHA domain-containing protein [Myxococcota bacterium]